VEGKNRQFEKKSAQRQQQSDQNQRSIDGPGKHPRKIGDGKDLDRPIEQRDTEEHNGRGGSADEKVLQAGLDPHLAIPPQRNQHVEGVAGEFQGHVDAEQMHAAHQQHHRQGTGNQQEVNIAVASPGHPLQVAAKADRQKKPQGKQHFEDLRVKIHPVGSRKQQALLAHGPQADHDAQSGQRQCSRIKAARSGT
jgi:hypothetical protein